MKIKGLLFDINGTLIDINTNEAYDEIYRAISRFLLYQGILLSAQDVRAEYYRRMDEQKKASAESFVEFDAVEVWRAFLQARPEACRALPPDKLIWLPTVLAEMYRGLSLFRLELYAEVRQTLDALRPRFRMAAVSDAQSAWALPEIRAMGLESFFDPIVVSGDLGFRKPDQRIFELALMGMELAPSEVLFVGNDMYRDVFGASRLGMKTVYYASNQGRKKSAGVEPDYILYHFGQLLEAVDFFEK
ncbi:HAD family hydrolase [Fundidesulfovibrio butyratiphilus]